jgi:hypothetical protein
MAWRFVMEHVPLTDEQVRRARSAVGLAYALQPTIQPRRGYCGLAGDEDAMTMAEP